LAHLAFVCLSSPQHVGAALRYCRLVCSPRSCRDVPRSQLTASTMSSAYNLHVDVDEPRAACSLLGLSLRARCHIIFIFAVNTLIAQGMHRQSRALGLASVLLDGSHGCNSSSLISPSSRRGYPHRTVLSAPALTIWSSSLLVYHACRSLFARDALPLGFISGSGSTSHLNAARR
jgi:hypothetical protein